MPATPEANFLREVPGIFVKSLFLKLNVLLKFLLISIIESTRPKKSHMIYRRHFTIILLASLFFSNCRVRKAGISCVNNNVCKRLTGNAVLYAVFVDTRYSRPWTTYDIMSTLDSIGRATRWIEGKAKENGVSLTIRTDYHQNKKVIPIYKDLPAKSVAATLLTIPPYYGILRTDRWANRVAQEAGKSYPTDTASLVRTKIKIKDRERLIAKLRDVYKTDNVALVYFVNNYYIDDLSVAMHTASKDDDAEYAIVSFKNPSVIAHEFLHLFGALDLYIGPWDSKRKARKKKAAAMKEFPDEIMAFAQRDIDSLQIGELTKYLIGWDKSLSDYYTRKLFGKRIQLVKY
jgi:hypothetical protein